MEGAQEKQYPIWAKTKRTVQMQTRNFLSLAAPQNCVRHLSIDSVGMKKFGHVILNIPD